MKKSYIYLLCITTAFLSVFIACQDELDKAPYGALEESNIKDTEGLNASLIAVYSMLDLYFGKLSDAYTSSPAGWAHSDVASDDALKGSTAGDQNVVTQFEIYKALPNNIYLENQWKSIYEGIFRANSFLALSKEADEDVSAADLLRMTAEARFLRGHFHFLAKIYWDNVPYVDENVEDPLKRVPNDKDIWGDIEADFQFAIDNLPPEQNDKGRATQGAAKAYLAKTYLFQKKYAAAKPLVESVINDYGYELAVNFHDNFSANKENGKESIFAIQASVNDGAKGRNGNYDNVLNFPHGAGNPGGCCGFFQPAQDLVNAFQVDASGLPLIDSFYVEDVKNDFGIESADPFTPETGPLDPRLDWTVGRRGIPYLGFGEHPGQSWVRNQANGGPYAPKKRMISKEDLASSSEDGGWGQLTTAVNYNIIRLADVILWAAEIEIEIGSLSQAQSYVNQIRDRAKSGSKVQNIAGTGDAANYVVEPYTSVWSDQEEARKAVRFERRLELALEGHRYFDLIRWEIAKATLESYAAREGEDGREYLEGVTFDAEKNARYPIPRNQIDLSTIDGEPTLTQNIGY